jgi:hypothetical protein
MTKILAVQSTRKADDYQTPPEALEPLYPFLDKSLTIWEPACGRGNLVKALHTHGYKTICSDIKEFSIPDFQLNDFLTSEIATHWDCIVTNPPYSTKDLFLKRCYYLRKPFALLMPLTTLEGKERQRLMRFYGIEIILFPKRINFFTPEGVNSSSPWFSTAWFSWGLNLGKALTFTQEGIRNRKLDSYGQCHGSTGSFREEYNPTAIQLKETTITMEDLTHGR